MPTEDFRWANSGNPDFLTGASGPGTKVMSTFNSSWAKLIIEKLKAALNAAGWQDLGEFHARIEMELPYGLPSYDPARSIVPGLPEAMFGTHVFTLGIKEELQHRYLFYDPTYNSAPTSPAEGDEWIPMGGSIGESIANFLAKVEATTDWHVLASYATGQSETWWKIILEADFGGPDWLSAEFGGGKTTLNSAGGIFIDAQQPWGGGYRLCSQFLNGQFIELWMYGADGGESFQVAMEFPTSSGTNRPRHLLPHGRFAQSAQDLARLDRDRVPYTVVANQFQFFLFRQVDPSSPDFEAQVFYSLPYLEHGTSFAAVLLINNWRLKLNWTPPTQFAVARHDGLLTGFANKWTRLISGAVPQYWGCYPTVYVYKAGGPFPLLTSREQPVIIPAYLGLPTGVSNSANGQAKIVGKLWDAVVMHKDVPPNSRMFYDGNVWICIASTSGNGGDVACSLWIAVG